MGRHSKDAEDEALTRSEPIVTTWAQINQPVVQNDVQREHD